MIIFARERNRPDAEQCFGASGICVGKCGGTQLVAVGKHNEDRGIGKELQPALHDCLEHWLRVGRRGADHAENLRGCRLLLTCLIAPTGEPRNICFFAGSEGPATCALRRITALQCLTPLRFYRFAGPPHCLPRGSGQWLNLARRKGVATRRSSRRIAALGHKWTFAPQKIMSALPSKADMCSATRYVRFVPIADIQEFGLSPKENPGRCPGAFLVSASRLLVKFVVQADTQNMIANFVFDVEWHSVHIDGVDRVRSKIKVQIFELGRPVICESSFHTGPGCPTDFRLIV